MYVYIYAIKYLSRDNLINNILSATTRTPIFGYRIAAIMQPVSSALIGIFPIFLQQLNLRNHPHTRRHHRRPCLPFLHY